MPFSDGLKGCLGQVGSHCNILPSNHSSFPVVILVCCCVAIAGCVFCELILWDLTQWLQCPHMWSTHV
jgi:hypothetical protein